MDEPTISGAELKAARERAHLTQEQAAARVGVKPLTVSRWERGAHPAPKAAVSVLMEYYREVAETYTPTSHGVSRGTSEDEEMLQAPVGGAADVGTPRQLQIRIREAEIEFLRDGANRFEMDYLHRVLTSPETMILREGGWTEPESAEEAMQELEVHIEMCRLWLREHMKRRLAKEREARRSGGPADAP